MSEEYRVFPLADHIRCTRDGRVESCLRRGPGGVRSDKWNVLTHAPDERGYPTVTVRRSDGRHRRMKVHQIVAWSWIGPPPEPGMLVRHLDDVKTNCHVGNLAWGTHQDNHDDAKRNGRLRYLSGPEHPGWKGGPRVSTALPRPASRPGRGCRRKPAQS